MVYLLDHGQEKNICKSIVGIFFTFFKRLIFSFSNQFPQTIVSFYISTGTVIENWYVLNQKSRVMKKNIQKKKQKRQPALRKGSFASYKEDFVITEQEEREGGYFGRYNFKTVIT